MIRQHYGAMFCHATCRHADTTPRLFARRCYRRDIRLMLPRHAFLLAAAPPPFIAAAVTAFIRRLFAISRRHADFTRAVMPRLMPPCQMPPPCFSLMFRYERRMPCHDERRQPCLRYFAAFVAAAAATARRCARRRLRHVTPPYDSAPCPQAAEYAAPTMTPLLPAAHYLPFDFAAAMFTRCCRYTCLTLFLSPRYSPFSLSAAHRCAMPPFMRTTRRDTHTPSLVPARRRSDAMVDTVRHRRPSMMPPFAIRHASTFCAPLPFEPDEELLFFEVSFLRPLHRQNTPLLK